jgi:NADPH:quinone reductase
LLPARREWRRSTRRDETTGGTERGRKLVAEHGAHHVLDHTSTDYTKRLLELTDGRGADVILEMLANLNLQKDLDVVARFGRIVVIGNRGTIEINPRGAMGKDAAIFGLALWNAPPAELSAIMAALTAGLANGTLRPVVGREFPLAEAAAAQKAVLEPGAYGKIVLVPDRSRVDRPGRAQSPAEATSARPNTGLSVRSTMAASPSVGKCST